MIKSTDVVIIGGGIIGASSAYYLSKSGLDVVIIEKDELCSGASGANQGGCPVSLFKPPLLELALESRRLYTRLDRDLEYDIELDESGLLICALERKYQYLLEHHLSVILEKGVKAKLLQGKELKKSSYNKVSSAIESQEDLIVNPFRLFFGFIYASKNNGTKVYTNTRAENIKIRNGTVHSIVTDKGEIQCQFVVNAAGVRSVEIAKMVGLEIPMKPQRGQILVTEPVPLSEYRYLIDAEYLTTAFDEGGVADKTSERLGLGVASSLAQEPTGNWTIGSSRDFAGYNKRTSLTTLTHIARRATKFIPEFSDINIIRTYAGLRPFCYKDGFPILGKVDEIEGFIFATGHAGEGVALAPVTGKLISEEIIQGKTSIPVDQFRFARF